MSEFKIVKGIPIPTTGRLGSRNSIPPNARLYPFLDMVPGDSVFIPGTRMRNKLSGSLAWARMKLNAQFLCHSVQGGVRVWRVA